jgi:hypothetical protein
MTVLLVAVGVVNGAKKPPDGVEYGTTTVLD